MVNRYHDPTLAVREWGWAPVLLTPQVRQEVLWRPDWDYSGSMPDPQWVKELNEHC